MKKAMPIPMPLFFNYSFFSPLNHQPPLVLFFFLICGLQSEDLYRSFFHYWANRKQLILTLKTAAENTINTQIEVTEPQRRRDADLNNFVDEAHVSDGVPLLHQDLLQMLDLENNRQGSSELL